MQSCGSGCVGVSGASSDSPVCAYNLFLQAVAGISFRHGLPISSNNVSIHAAHLDRERFQEASSHSVAPIVPAFAAMTTRRENKLVAHDPQKAGKTGMGAVSHDSIGT